MEVGKEADVCLVMYQHYGGVAEEKNSYGIKFGDANHYTIGVNCTYILIRSELE